MNFTLQQIANTSGGKLTGHNNNVERYIFDSRTLAPVEGTIFCAIPTASSDGHNYIETAYSRGIRSFLVEQLPEMLHTDASYVQVNSIQESLESLTIAARHRLDGKHIIGITGSRGKTVVKELLFQMLTAAGKKAWRSPRSWNSRLGVPMSLLNAPQDADFYIFEAGIDSADGMSPLADMIRPNFGILTSITDAHNAGFNSQDEKIAEKAKLFAGCETIVTDNSNENPAAILRSLYPDSEAIAITADSTYARNLAIAQAAASALGITPVEPDHENQPDNRIEVFEGVNNSLVLQDRFTPDSLSVEAALDIMNRRKVNGRSNTLIATADVTADSRMLQRYGIDRVIAADNSFFRHFEASDFHNETILIAVGPTTLSDDIRSMIEAPRHDTVFEINLNSITHNINYYRSLLPPGTGIVGMVKAQGYGTGALEVAKTLQSQGADYLAVAVIDEGVALRRGGITMPIMVLNPVTSNYGAMFRHKLEPSVFSIDELKLLTERARQYGIAQFKAHIKLDTGMHRVGFTPEEIPSLLAELPKHPQLHIASIFSHLATADCPDQQEYTTLQLDTFKKGSETIATALPYPVKRHILNTAGIQTHPEHHYDMVRLGIGLYGVSPVDITPGTLAVVATLKSTIISVKHWPAGTTIGYGRRGVLSRDSVIATVAIGYADGIDRHLGCGNASFIVKGHECPTVGNICMDQLMIDVTDVPDAAPGDEVEIFGTQQPVERLAEILGTIPYELIATVSPRVARIYYND